MKRLLILACALAIATTAVAAQGKPITSDYSGFVDKFDAATQTLTVKRKDNKQGEFVLNDKSEVLDGKTKADAAKADAFSALQRQIHLSRISRDLTVIEFLNAVDGADQLRSALQSAAQIDGGARWLDDNICQMKLKINGQDVAKLGTMTASQLLASGTVGVGVTAVLSLERAGAPPF